MPYERRIQTASTAAAPLLLDFLIGHFARATAELLCDLAYQPGRQGHEVERTL
jgi:hypothetical protein